jgi:hypothetical protein
VDGHPAEHLVLALQHREALPFEEPPGQLARLGEQPLDALRARHGLQRLIQPRRDAAAGRLGRAEQPVDVPVRFQVDERDQVARLVCGNQDQPAIPGAPVFPLGIPASGNPGLHLFIRVIGQRHLADGMVEDIGNAGGIPLLIGPDDYLHRPDTTG